MCKLTELSNNVVQESGMSALIIAIEAQVENVQNAFVGRPFGHDFRRSLNLAPCVFARGPHGNCTGALLGQIRLAVALEWLAVHLAHRPRLPVNKSEIFHRSARLGRRKRHRRRSDGAGSRAAPRRRRRRHRSDQIANFRVCPDQFLLQTEILFLGCGLIAFESIFVLIQRRIGSIFHSFLRFLLLSGCWSVVCCGSYWGLGVLLLFRVD